MVDEPGRRRSRLTARSPITVAQGLLDIEPLLVPSVVPLDDLTRRAGASPSTRVVGVVDASGVLVGVVASQDVVVAVVGRVTPGALIADIHGVAGVQEYDRFVKGRTAGDLMRPPATVSPTATLADAFRLMHAQGLCGLCVVDEAGRPTGYVDGLGLAAAVEAASPDSPAA